MFFEINRNLCETYIGLDPIKLLDYPAEDVFELIKQTADYNRRYSKTGTNKVKGAGGVIRRKAGDNWF